MDANVIQILVKADKFTAAQDYWLNLDTEETRAYEEREILQPFIVRGSQQIIPRGSFLVAVVTRTNLVMVHDEMERGEYGQDWMPDNIKPSLHKIVDQAKKALGNPKALQNLISKYG